MKKKIFLFLSGMLVCSAIIAQQLPLGACGIVCTYDASGNRLKRVYFCNNGVDPYPTRAKLQETKTTTEAQLIDALISQSYHGQVCRYIQQRAQERFRNTHRYERQAGAAI